MVQTTGKLAFQLGGVQTVQHKQDDVPGNHYKDEDLDHEPGGHFLCEGDAPLTLLLDPLAHLGLQLKAVADLVKNVQLGHCASQDLLVDLH